MGQICEVCALFANSMKFGIKLENNTKIRMEAKLKTTYNTHTYTHNHFMALFYSVQDYPGEPSAER